MLSEFIYKIYPPEEYAVRYTHDGKVAYAKVKGGKEFRTDFKKNNTGFEAVQGGDEVSQTEYENY